MSLFLGFVLGVIASVIASVVISAIPPHKQRKVIAVLRNPWLNFQLLRSTPHQEIKAVLCKLFNAWEKKDLDSYLSCWSTDAVRVVGPMSQRQDGFEDLRVTFSAAIGKYKTITVSSVIFEKIEFEASRPADASAMLHYRFDLVRASDGLPVSEEATEFYALRKSEEDGWQIASNLDHSKDVAK